MRCAVIGDPVSHSLSPAIHREGYRSVGLEWSYDAISVSESDLAGFVDRCAADPAWVGLSVTAPHKQQICRYGEADATTRLVGAGNTVLFNQSQISIFNTDVSGFIRAFRAAELPAPRVSAIVGNGATARSIAVALVGLEVKELIVLARNPHRATDLVDLGHQLGVTTTAVPLEEKLGGIDLLASTVPGEATAPYAASWVAASAAIFDVVYDPWPTPLGRAAAAVSRPALNGLDLLAGQAVDQFALMTTQQVSFEQCRRAAGRELQRRADL